MNFPTITRYNWMCCSIILVFLALSSPKPLQAQENQKERITFVSSTEILVTQHTKAPPKYIDGALPYELCLSLRKFDQFSTYLTIVLTASSPSTATATIPAGTAIVALSEVRTVSATTLPKMLVITTDLPAAP